MAKEKKAPPPWWREPPYTTLPNSYLLKLAHSDLTGNEFRGLISIWVHTLGASGAKWGTYGRESEPLSAASIAAETGIGRRNAQGIVRRLVAKGALLVVACGSGKRGTTLAPSRELNPQAEASPPAPVKPVTAEPEEAAPPADPTPMRDYLAEKRAERRAAAIKHGLGGTA